MKPRILLLLLIAVPLARIHAAEPVRPNVILIISDDHGFPDYGFMGNKEVRTPCLDRMTSQGLLYTRGYVTPVCSPSLASLLTGKLPAAHGITGNDLSTAKADRHLLAKKLLGNELLLPKALKDAGYLTFQTGKLWNVTYPEVGFTHGMTDTAGRHGDAGLEIGRKGMKPVYDFIAEAREKKKPFFVWHAPLLPHEPHNPPEEILARYRGKGPTAAAEKYHAMVEWFDTTCGELDDYLTRNKLADNTVILYLADNGWDAARGRIGKRSKLSPYELGIRTPMFIRWPGKIKPLRDDETLASIIDFVPTILNLCGVKPPAALPGLDLLDREAMTARKSITMQAYTHDIMDLENPAKSLIAEVVIDGWSKLLIPGMVAPDRPHSSAPKTVELFDLKADPLETNNLAGQRPDEVERIRNLHPSIVPGKRQPVDPTAP